MIRSIEKLKVRIDQNLNRAEKSEALREDVAKVESKALNILVKLELHARLLLCCFSRT